MQIGTCGTYRRRSQPLAPFSDESRVALHVVGMLLTVAPPVVAARSVLLLLQRINPAKVIRVLSPPLLIGLPLLLAATLRLTTGLLPLFKPRVGMKPTTTERTPSPWEHTFPSRDHLEEKQTKEVGEEEKKAKGKGSIEIDLEEREENQKIRRLKHKSTRHIGPDVFPDIGRLTA